MATRHDPLTDRSIKRIEEETQRKEELKKENKKKVYQEENASFSRVNAG